MKYLIVLFTILFVLGCEPGKKLVEQDNILEKHDTVDSLASQTDSVKIEKITYKYDYEGTWDIISMAGRVLSENESGSIVFRFNENQSHPELRNSIGAFIGCNDILGLAKIEDNNIKYSMQTRTEMYCADLDELEKELIFHFYSVKNYKLENGLLILTNKEDEITFILKRSIGK